MNIDRLIDRFFKGTNSNVSIEVFDEQNIYNVYSDVVRLLNNYPEIELTILQSLAYCLYEILDNVLTHSGKKMGTTVTLFDKEKSLLKILVADDGIGIRKSLSENPEYGNVTEEDALRLCLKDSVTDGKGMGFGLYSTMQLIKNAGILMQIHSGCHLLSYEDSQITVREISEWQGTLVFLELYSDKVIDPRHVLGEKADAEGNYEELFGEHDELDNLW